MKGMIVVKAHRCTGCKSCEIACAVEHSASQDLFTAILEDPAPVPRVGVAQGEGFVVPLQCRQCADAPCMAVCPTHALRRADKNSPVVLSAEQCIGCTWCVLACPFGVIKLDERHHAIIKCDQCVERLARGEQPACVVACPTGALEFKSQQDVLTEKREAYLVQIGCSLVGGEK